MIKVRLIIGRFVLHSTSYNVTRTCMYFVILNYVTIIQLLIAFTYMDSL